MLTVKPLARARAILWTDFISSMKTLHSTIGTGRKGEWCQAALV
jgi:hypothetical protein